MSNRNRVLLIGAGLCLAVCFANANAFESPEPGHQAEPVATLAAFPSDVVQTEPRFVTADTFANHEAIPMSVRAKVVCNTKNLTAHQKADGSTVEAATVSFGGVFKPTFDPADPKKQIPGNAVSENAIFGEYSPNVNISMYITNPDAHRQFEPGKYYYVDFEPAPAT